ncbi:MAG: 50S ribosomal protein L24 [Candidatus Paceibacterota bacterium]|jgi:large subunit ribosomal protein L24
MKIKKGDKVMVVKGKDRGKVAKVLRAFPADNKVLVEGVNIKKSHQKPRKQGQKGQIVEQAAPMHVSNVMIVDPKSDKPTRTGVKMIGEKKTRVTKKSGAELE